MVDEGDVDEQGDAAVAVKPHQVDVGRGVFHHVTLHAAADHAHILLAFDLEVEQRLQEAARFQFFQQRIVVEVQRDGLFAITVNDTGYVALTTSLTSGPLACPRPYLGVKIRDLTSH